ncbi:hypothetical protein AVEN_54337-1 [Araneus ventricosus]|uniref:Uncharacterized protein n=1 Tax=Araneus ventricosus TaxID=182803 RepID=A0A4Y2GBZ6_ARAVE|nr:hypothetical protein AVEN_54337-1 [Araneus ventricosus]
MYSSHHWELLGHRISHAEHYTAEHHKADFPLVTLLVTPTSNSVSISLVGVIVKPSFCHNPTEVSGTISSYGYDPISDNPKNSKFTVTMLMINHIRPFVPVSTSHPKRI